MVARPLTRVECPVRESNPTTLRLGGASPHPTAGTIALMGLEPMIDGYEPPALTAWLQSSARVGESGSPYDSRGSRLEREMNESNARLRVWSLLGHHDLSPLGGPTGFKPVLRGSHPRVLIADTMVPASRGGIEPPHPAFAGPAPHPSTGSNSADDGTRTRDLHRDKVTATPLACIGWPPV